jgi:gamma-glutamyltranspeptidase/glutathione hydrolase
MQAVLTLVEPQSSGIGGGALIMLWDGKNVRTYDGRETAPAGATERLFLQADGTPMPFTRAQIGGRSVGTPGVLRALELAHKNMAACLGRSCSNRRSNWRSKASPFRHACTS